MRFNEINQTNNVGPCSVVAGAVEITSTENNLATYSVPLYLRAYGNDQRSCVGVNVINVTMELNGCQVQPGN